MVLAGIVALVEVVVLPVSHAGMDESEGAVYVADAVVSAAAVCAYVGVD